MHDGYAASSAVQLFGFRKRMREKQCNAEIDALSNGAKKGNISESHLIHRRCFKIGENFEYFKKTIIALINKLQWLLFEFRKVNVEIQEGLVGNGICNEKTLIVFTYQKLKWRTNLVDNCHRVGLRAKSFELEFGAWLICLQIRHAISKPRYTSFFNVDGLCASAQDCGHQLNVHDLWCVC